MMFEIHYIIFCLYISIATVHTIYSDLFVDLNCNSTCDVWNTIYDILLENLYCNGRWDEGHTFYIILFVDLYCNSTWDEISCWPDTEPNTTVHLQCADYINGFYVNSEYHSELLGTSRQSSVNHLKWTSGSFSEPSSAGKGIKSKICVCSEYV